MALPTVPIDEQIRLACHELSGHLRAGHDSRAEEFLAQITGGDRALDSALELLYTEFVVREELGQNPDPVDWYRRFPQYRNDLEELFQIHGYLREQEQVLGVARSTLVSARIDDTSPVLGASDTAVKQSVPGYQLLEVIGRGGMGVVYKARQTSVDRIVAVKMILSGQHAGAAEHARFQNEAQAAASLQHPHIAQVFEAGEYDGQPYLVMEFVEGTSLESVLAKAPLAGRSAAELLRTLADAANYAHQRGIIHRDLKPSNVLLSADGQPKITDFGLAKRLEDIDRSPMTQTGMVLGTPSYMPPEQATGDHGASGPRSDVYALGAILYESITGRPPHVGNNLTDILQQIRTTDPVRPRVIDQRIPRDLETICLKCLEKQPANRYGSAADLSLDLGRFLEGQPIHARPTTRWERVVKWSRRRPVTAALMATIALVAAVGAAGIAWQARRAMVEATVSREVSSFFGDLLTSINPDLTRGRAITVREVLDDAAAHLDASPNVHPRIRSGLHDALGVTYARIGALRLAEKHLRAAVQMYESERGPDDPRTLKMLGNLAYTLKGLDRLEDAERMARKGLQTATHALGEDDAATCLLRTNLAVIVDARGNKKEAGRLYRKDLAIMRRIHGDSHRATLFAMGNLGSWLLANGESDEAKATITSCLVAHRKTLGDDHPSTLIAQANLVAVLANEGRWDDAVAEATELVRLSRKVHGPDAAVTLVRQSNLAKLLVPLKRLDEARDHAEHAWRGLRVALGPAHVESVAATEILVTVLGFSDRMKEAEDIALGCYDDVVRSADAKDALAPRAALLLANLYESWGRPDQQHRWEATARKSRQPK
ncbi:MAG TPA: serine/threonine-protein kinase [Pirellulaceae bacterium]